VVEMRKVAVPLAAATLAVLLSLGVSGSMTGDAEALTAKPNIVFILADDMRRDDPTYMPKTRSLLGDKGMSFSNAYVSNPLCCPSRATIMRGQYAHNTGVWDNIDGKDSGWQGYKSNCEYAIGGCGRRLGAV
jgi:arylsulfatase A-like enzyme